MCEKLYRKIRLPAGEKTDRRPAPLGPIAREQNRVNQLQFFRPGNFSEFAIKSPQRKMPRLAGQLKDQTVGETQPGMLAKEIQSCCYCLGVFYR